MTIVKCEQCAKDFYTRPAHIRAGWGRFCSMKCKSLVAQKRITVSCAVCQKSLVKKASVIAKSKSGKFFCDKSCQAVWRNKEFAGEKHTQWQGGFSRYRKMLLETGAVQKYFFCFEFKSAFFCLYMVFPHQ